MDKHILIQSSITNTKVHDSYLLKRELSITVLVPTLHKKKVIHKM